MVTEHVFGSASDMKVTADLIRHEMGLDRPVYEQYGKWVWDILSKGDLGKSLWNNQQVGHEIFQRLPVSVELGAMAIVVALVIAIPIGIYSGIRQDTGGDYIARSIGILFICLPSFWIGTMVFVFPSIWWGWVPSIELIPFTKDPAGNLAMFILPAVILGMATSGTTMRMTRTMMLETLRQDYIRTAWAKGLRERVVVLRHALKNSLIPVVTLIGINIPVLVGGSVIIENIFNLPGMGRLLLDAISQRDYPVVSGVNVVVAAFVLLTNLVVDLTYGWLDPRIHYR
jgi:peptide/nickel transport system permease protein